MFKSDSKGESCHGLSVTHLNFSSYSGVLYKLHCKVLCGDMVLASVSSSLA